jgi:deazaflavin-dependent oxidoreductase (nitroreductase family)
MTTIVHEQAREAKPLFGLRRRPGRLALAVMRMPRPLYRHGLGWMLDHTFLLITHQGRKTGQLRETVAMALTYDPMTRGAIVCSAWGANTDWIRNLRARPALRIQIGHESYVPEQRFLSDDESVAVGVEFRRRHPRRLRLLATILGWGDLSSESGMREFVRSRPFVSFRPAHPATSRSETNNALGHGSYCVEEAGRGARSMRCVARRQG